MDDARLKDYAHVRAEQMHKLMTEGKYVSASTIGYSALKMIELRGSEMHLPEGDQADGTFRVRRETA